MRQVNLSSYLKLAVMAALITGYVACDDDNPSPTGPLPGTDSTGTEGGTGTRSGTTFIYFQSNTTA